MMSETCLLNITCIGSHLCGPQSLGSSRNTIRKFKKLVYTIFLPSMAQWTI